MAKTDWYFEQNEMGGLVVLAWCPVWKILALPAGMSDIYYFLIGIHDSFAYSVLLVYLLKLLFCHN